MHTSGTLFVMILEIKKKTAKSYGKTACFLANFDVFHYAFQLAFFNIYFLFIITIL